MYVSFYFVQKISTFPDAKSNIRPTTTAMINKIQVLKIQVLAK